jgi:hypothetical protein
MPNMEISTYAVGTNRQRSASNYHRRFLMLEPKNPTSTVEHIVIYFFIQAKAADDPDVGYQTPTSTKYVVGYAPVDDFDVMYRLLQSEKPINFSWAADSSNKLHWFGLATTSEPLGEGPKDAQVALQAAPA